MNMPQEQFRISIDAFDGPLDLLLYLVRRAEVDIHDIPIAQITDEYLQVLRDGVSVDVEMAGEFLVMAATLIEIKSRALVPPEQVAEDDELHESEDLGADPRGDLIRQLLAFQRFRTASEQLELKRNSFALQFYCSIGVSQSPTVEEEPSLELDDVHILDLSDAYEHIASAIDFTRLGEHHIAFDDIPIEFCQEDLIDRLHRCNGSALTLHSTFEGLTLAERVGMFLATLELVRIRKVTVQQDEQSDAILISLLVEDETVTGDESNSEARSLPEA
ncbi:MAG: segregation/condensation protein A [Phycisphaerae bacterium]|nr:segregation/condensation protein A [Phycisphaerae bacterium]